MDMNKHRLYLTNSVLLIAAILCGCATNVPTAVQQAPAEAVSVLQVQQAAEKYTGRDVRWGGEIIFVENGSDITDMAVLATSLGSKGKPDTDGDLDARFIARIPGFLDPVEFAEGRQVTVTGVIAGVESRLVGDYAYVYPLVQVQAYHLWPKEKPRTYYYYPYPYHYPWYGYGPWGRYPYWW